MCSQRNIVLLWYLATVLAVTAFIEGIIDLIVFPIYDVVSARFVPIWILTIMGTAGCVSDVF